MSGPIGVEIIVILMYTPQILCSLMMLVIVWFGGGCSLDLGVVSSVVNSLLLIVPVPTLLECIRLNKKSHAVMVVISIFVVVFGFFYLIIAMSINHKKTPHCRPKWSIVMIWIYIGVTFLNSMIPLLCLACFHICSYLDRKKADKKNKRLIAMIPEFYRSDRTFEEVLQSSKYEKRLKQLVLSEKFSEEEIKIIEKIENDACLVIDNVGIQGFQTICSVCGEDLMEKYDDMDSEKRCINIPGCLHSYHMVCFVDHFKIRGRNMKCVVCDNHVRLAILAQLKGISIEETNMFFNNQIEAIHFKMREIFEP